MRELRATFKSLDVDVKRELLMQLKPILRGVVPASYWHSLYPKGKGAAPVDNNDGYKSA